MSDRSVAGGKVRRLFVADYDSLVRFDGGIGVDPGVG
jgi:hypothetical protein